MVLLSMAVLMGMINKLLLLRYVIKTYSFSRKVLWLEVSPTNKDSFVIAGFYLAAVEKYGNLYYHQIILYRHHVCMHNNNLMNVRLSKTSAC